MIIILLLALLLSSNAFAVNTGTMDIQGTLTLAQIASGTQCLHANSSGLVSGTGSDCGGGSGSNYWLLSTGNVGIYTVSPYNVGIGSTVPGQALDVQGTLRDIGEIINGSGNNYFGGNIGIGTTTGNQVNNLAVQGAVSIGPAAYAGTAAPLNGLIVSGNVGIGSLSPGSAFDQVGTARIGLNGNVGIGTQFTGAEISIRCSAGSGDDVCITTNGNGAQCIGYCTAGTFPACSTCTCCS